MRAAALITLSSGLAGAILACGLPDAFASSRLEAVVLTWVGPSVLAPGTTVPLTITVSANGIPVPSPRLTLSSSDPTILAITAGGDSLAALANGSAVLTAQLQSSVLTDSLPTLQQTFRIHP